MHASQPRYFLILACLLVATLGSSAQSNYSTPYYFSTFAGTNSIGTADGSGTNARFFNPDGIATDINGNVFLSDSQNHTIRKISPGGVVTTLAGLAGIKGSNDGTGGAARFQNPRGLAVDASGNVFVADSGNRTIRKITPSGVVTTLAGQAGEQGTANGTGSSARFKNPLGLTISVDGNLYVADDSGDLSVSYNDRDAEESLVRKITPGGVVTTFATGLNKNTYNSSGTFFVRPFQAITSDTNGNIIVACATGVTQVESNLIRVDQSIIKYAPDGSSRDPIYIAATVSRAPSGSPYPPGPSGFITDLAIDQNGRLLVAEYYQISRFDLTIPSTPVETVLVSSRTNVPGLTGNSPNLGTNLRLAADRNGNVLIADSDENAVYRLTSNQTISTLAGMPVIKASQSKDGTGSAARFRSPNGLCTDATGNLYTADLLDHVIRKISPEGIVTTLAGLAGSSGNSNGTGSVARFSNPSGVVADRNGTLYVADTRNCVIRRIKPSGEVDNFAGSGTAGSQDGPASSAGFYAPRDLTIDGSGNLYVIDDHGIRKISPSGDVSTLAGSPSQSGYMDGSGSTARFNYPLGIAADASGNIYVADAGNQAIRRVSSTGNVTTLAGGTAMAGATDGKLAVAGFLYPTDLSFDDKGNLFVVDLWNYTIRKITPDGDVSTVAGLAGIGTNTDGLGEKARFASPYQITSDQKGNLFVGNITAIAKGQLAGPPVIITQPASQTTATGSNVQFSVTAGGVPEPTYQWYFNGSPFAGATSTSLGFTNARNTDAGDYTVVITNSLGSVTSNKAALTVTAAPATPPSSPGGSSGGGSIGAWFVLALAALAAMRNRALSERTSF